MALIEKAAVGGNVTDRKMSVREERYSLAYLGLSLIFAQTHPVAFPESTRKINRVNIREFRALAEAWRKRGVGFESFENTRYASWHDSARCDGVSN